MSLKDQEFFIDYVDTLAIIDRNYRIIDTLRFNPRFDNTSHKEVYSSYINKNYFEVYPELSKKESSFTECFKTGKVVKRKNQKFVDFHGNVFRSNNITIPIIKKGKIVGAIELSKDITTTNDIKVKKDFNGHSNNSFHVRNNKDITFNDIITKNKKMLNMIEKAKTYSETNNPTLIYGETGTGKEMFARSIYNYGNRRKQKFVTQNCAAIPKNLFESILFGSEEGAFTGAQKREGLFKVANGGILFLDEINSMPQYLQAKLLRVIENKEIRPVGSDEKYNIDVKIIAAMNKDPKNAIKDDILRQDLFYRFSGEILELIPLRERIEDISLYLKNFVNEYNSTYNKNINDISNDLLNFLKKYKWEGNVRELKHSIQSMVSTAKENTLDIKHLPVYMEEKLDVGVKTKSRNKNNDLEFPVSLNKKISKTEKEMITKALNRSNGNITKAGNLLKIPRQTLNYKIKKYNIEVKNYK